MSKYLMYVFEVSCVFTALYSVYYMVFRRLTFHTLNRLLLLVSLPLSFIIPVLDIGFHAAANSVLDIPKFEEIVSVGQSTIIGVTASVSPFNFVNILLSIYCIGFLVYMIKLVRSVLILFNTRQESQVSFADGFFIITANVPSVFSCFKWIFVPGNYVHIPNDPVIEHEKLHARLWHTIDLILTELFIALLWFLPVVFFFRKSIKSVHEYQVDSRIIRSTTKKSHYLKLMLGNLESRHKMIGLYNYFNGLTIKNRIKMITKNKSNNFQLLRYFVLIPLIAVLTMAFTKSGGEKPEIFPIKKGEYTKLTVEHGEKIMNPFTNSEKMHKGIDIKAAEGVSVMASAGGTVARVSSEKGWGNLIVIDHGSGYETWYAHLKDFSVKQGEKVEKGQEVGHVGNTGYSTGPHLHYEVRLNGESVDPMEYVGK